MQNRPRMPHWFTPKHAEFFRKHFTENEFNAFKDQKEGLINEANAAGIPTEDIKHYWYKSKKYSIFAKNKELDLKKAIDETTQKLREIAPNVARYERKRYNKPVLLCISPSDVHFGKLATIEETGEKYDLEKAKERLINGVTGILDYTTSFNIEQIVIVGGNDVLHTDTLHNTTTKGTPQDVSGKFYETFTAAFESYVHIIEMLSKKTDIYYIHTMSNHDYLSGYYFSKSLEAYFCNNPNIVFNTKANPRKYLAYGVNLLGFTHGDTAKDRDLVDLMKIEAKNTWSKCIYGYWYLGHLHHHIRKNSKQILSKDYNDITVLRESNNIIKDKVHIEYLRSISGADAWHNAQGYKSKPALEAFLHSPELGQIARFTKYVD